MSNSSKRWLQSHHRDPFVHQARQEGYRSRAAYKLIAMQEKYQLFKPNMTVVDLGAAPGGWTQVLIEHCHHVVALDILPMDSIAGVTFIQGDFTTDACYDELLDVTNNQSIDWVVSDMAPNMSGNKTTDQARAMHLVELAHDFAQTVTPKQGLVVKAFQGKDFDQFVQTLRQTFKKVIITKPQASSSRSAEVYIIARK